MKLRFDPWDVGWRIGTAHEPRGGELWVPWDRTAGVIGPQGSGKTLDLLTPALLGAPGAALVTLTKVEDLLLSLTERSRDDRPVRGARPVRPRRGPGGTGFDELVWDPIAGCVDPMVAERRAKAFTAGTVKGAINGGTGDDAARFYAAEAAKVLQAYFHAAALTGRTLEDVLRWVANPPPPPTRARSCASTRTPRRSGTACCTARCTATTAPPATPSPRCSRPCRLFFQADIRRRCIPSPGRPATDLADVIRRRGTIYLLGREDPYASASPLMTAVAEHVLDTGLLLANSSPWGGRLCPPLLACLDELPSTAPLPTLRTRMANERALGLSFIYAAQTRPQLTSIFGEHEARALLGLTNVLVMFGGSKDVAFNQEISDLLGTVRVGRVTHSHRRINGGGRTFSGDDIPILRPEEVRQLPERHALVIAENGKPIIAKLHRCVDGKAGARLLADQRRAARAPHQRPAHGHHPRGPRHRRPGRGPPSRVRRRRPDHARSELQ